MNIEQLDEAMGLPSSVGRFVNRSEFKDQLTKKNKKDAGLDVQAVLTNFNDENECMTGEEEPIETIVYGPTGATYLHDVRDIVIPPGGRARINAMIEIAVPDDCYGRLASRSGLSAKYGIEVGAGTVDIPYRGLVGIVLYNHGFDDYVVAHGDRIAQLITTKVDLRPYIQVESLDETDRGVKGFGSSGR